MKFLILVLFSVTTHVAQAVETASATSKSISPKLSICASQIQMFCADEKVPGAIAKCLIKHEPQLSAECKQELARIGRASDQAAEQGGGALSALVGLNSLTPPFGIFSYEGRYSPGGNSLNEDKFNISSPIKQSPEDYLGASVAGGRVHLGQAVTLDSGLVVPNDVYRAELGMQYTHQLSDHKNWGIRGSVGYAGDKVFEKMSDTTFSMNLQYGYPGQGGGFWMWVLFISNNSPFGSYAPIPGVIYFYKSPTFTGMFGFPLTSMQWTPSSDWAYSLSAFGPTITAEAAYGELQSVRYFTSFNLNNQSFLLSNREDDKDRFNLEEKKVAIGARSFVFGFMQLELQGGYAFDRLLYVGKGFRDMRRGSALLDSEYFISWALKAAF